MPTNGFPALIKGACRNLSWPLLALFCAMLHHLGAILHQHGAKTFEKNPILAPRHTKRAPRDTRNASLSAKKRHLNRFATANQAANHDLQAANQVTLICNLICKKNIVKHKGHLGFSLAHLGVQIGQLSAILCPTWPILEASWRRVGQLSAPSWPF